MGLFSKLNRSADLALGMADRRDVNIAGHILDSPERAGQEFRNILLRCAYCADQDGCAALQAKTNHLEAAPDYCMNKTVFDGV